MRFKVGHVMAVVLLAGVGLAALRDPSPLWASVLFTAAVGLPLAAILKAVACPASERLPWIGMALFGLGFLSVSFNLPRTDLTPVGRNPPPSLLPAALLWEIGPSINLDIQMVQAGGQQNAARLGGLSGSINRSVAYQSCAGSLSVLILAALGYVLGHLLRGSSPEDP